MNGFARIGECPACGRKHSNLKLHMLRTPIQIDGLLYLQWTLCSNDGKRLLVRKNNGTTEVAKA